MPSEAIELLARLKTGTYENCVIITYNADLFFFEQVVLPTLRSHGCYNNLLLMDLKQYDLSLASAGHMLGRLGKSYSVLPVPASGAFHPKVILQTGSRNGRLILGSGNLTVRGFSSNWELFSEVSRTGESEGDGLFQQIWRYIRTVAQGAVGATERQLRQVEETSPWLAEDAEAPTWPRLLLGQPGGTSIVAQLREAIGNTAIQRLVVLSPCFDPELRGVRELVDTFKPQQVWLVVQPDSVSIPGNKISKLKIKEFFVSQFNAPQSGKSAEAFLHAKTYIFESKSADYCLWGSPNCSKAALVEPTNFEVGLLQKGKPGEFVKTLNLASSLKKNRCIDPSGLSLREQKATAGSGSFRLLAAEMRDDTIQVFVAGDGFGEEVRRGRLMFWGAGRPLGEVEAIRQAEKTFTAKPRLPHAGGTVICRLTIGNGADAVTSTPAAVHFLGEIAESTPSRRSCQADRISAAIRSGSADWAKGLESIVELLFRIESSEAGDDGVGQTHQVASKKEKSEDTEIADEQFQEYEDFVGSTAQARGKGASAASLFLEDILSALSSQMLRGVEESSDDEDLDGSDLAKYQEEAESGSAEAGVVVEGHGFLDADEAFEAHRRIRNAYHRLMQRLAKRCEWLRDNGSTVSADDFWRLSAVNLLALNGCGRTLSQAESFGTVLEPYNVLGDLLPSMAVLLGRVRVLRSDNANSGPLGFRASLDISDHRTRQFGAITALILSALVDRRRHWNKQPVFFRGEDDPNGWPYFTDIVATRSIATLSRLGLLPTAEEYSAVLGNSLKTSSWLSGIGVACLEKTFAELSRRAKVIRDVEDKFNPNRLPASTVQLKPGAWVCAPSSGVTEVAEITGQFVQLAFIGEPEDDTWFRKIKANCVQPTGLSRSC